MRIVAPFIVEEAPALGEVVGLDCPRCNAAVEGVVIWVRRCPPSPAHRADDVAEVCFEIRH